MSVITMPEIRAERTGWCDEGLSHEHRNGALTVRLLI